MSYLSRLRRTRRIAYGSSIGISLDIQQLRNARDERYRIADCIHCNGCNSAVPRSDFDQHLLESTFCMEVGDHVRELLTERRLIPQVTCDHCGMLTSSIDSHYNESPFCIPTALSQSFVGAGEAADSVQDDIGSLSDMSDDPMDIGSVIDEDIDDLSPDDNNLEVATNINIPVIPANDVLNNDVVDDDSFVNALPSLGDEVVLEDGEDFSKRHLLTPMEQACFKVLKILGTKNLGLYD